MKSVEIEARSVEEAVEQALQALDARKEDVRVTVLEESKKGLLSSILGSKSKVLVELVEPEPEPEVTVAAKALSFTKGLLEEMGFFAEIEVEERDNQINISITGEDLGVLIGRRGQNLDALQYLVGIAVNRGKDDWVRIFVDIEGYRERRLENLRATARRAAGKALASSKRMALEPMNPMERRVVHQELQEFKGVETHSEGKDPYRRIIIVPTR